MRILLLGEMSGFYTTLKAGLCEYGHEVYLVSNGDGYKDFPADFRWDSPHTNWPRLFRGAHTRMRMVSMLRRLSGFDVVMAVSFTPISERNILLNKALFSFLKKNNGRVYVSGAALSETCCKYWLNSEDTKLKNYLSLDFDEINKRGGKLLTEDERDRYCEYEDYVLSMIDGYIPVMYEYSRPYRNKEKVKQSIPLPVNVDEFEYAPNRVDGKLVFFNGKTRLSKGGAYVEEAFNRLRTQYSEKAIFIREGGLPFSEYNKLLRNSNVILDNINNHSYGMNQLFAMLQGKVVMGGSDFIGAADIYKDTPPSVELEPDTNSICAEIEKLIDKTGQIEQIGWESRQFVVNNHDYRLITKKYIDLWNEQR